MKNYFFAIGYIPHRLWGNILIAQLLEKDAAAIYYVTGEILLYNERALSYQRLSTVEKEVVKLIDRYNEKTLHRLFSKKATVKEFQDTVDEKTIEKFIRPYIEKQMYRVLEIAAENSLKIFIKEKATQNIFSEDFLVVHHRKATPRFHFSRGEEGTTYRLSVFYGDREVRLNRENAQILCNDPAAVVLDNHLYFIEGIEARKLTPFFSKEEIFVQRKAESRYFAVFVSGILRDHDAVETHGFDVSETIPVKRAVLSLEHGMNQKPAWLLRLKYNDVSVLPASAQQRFVKFSEENDEFAFTRFSRDLSWEDDLDVLLQEIGLKSRDGNIYTLTQSSDETPEETVFQAVNFTNNHFNYLTSHGIEVVHRLDREYSLADVSLEVTSKEREDWFDLRAIVKFGVHEISFLQLRKFILEDNRLFPLPDGTIAVLPLEWFARYRAIFEFGREEDGLLRIHKQHFSQVDDSMRKEHAHTISRLEKLSELEEIPRLAPPAELVAELRSYQHDGISWLWFLQENGFGGCLADDMGLGKTLQAIAILQHAKERSQADPPDAAGPAHSADPPDAAGLPHTDAAGFPHTDAQSGTGQPPLSLVVVPASLVQNWKNEIERYAPRLKVSLHVGIHRERSADHFKKFDVIISSYHTVRQDIGMLREYLFHYVILDESQTIKNPASKLYRAMEQLQARHRLVLTGTPIENSLTDLWSQINFVNRGLLGSLNFFKKRFVQPIEKKKNKDQEQRLKELINPFILRRTKDEVAKELPPVYEQTRYCDMTQEQKRIYEEEKSSVRNSILDTLDDISPDKSAMIVLQALTRLRQISNHPLLVDEAYENGSGKFDEVFMDIESVVSEGHKVLVFSSFVKHLDLYADRLTEMGWNYAYLTGRTTRRAEEVARFQEDPECKIFLISLKAGGVGLNLTAADYVFILDPWWNPAAELQALNRAHRIGQDKNVFVYRFISNDTVEQKIRRLQERKSELAKTFVTSNNPLRDMKKEDILELFS